MQGLLEVLHNGLTTITAGRLSPDTQVEKKLNIGLLKERLHLTVMTKYVSIRNFV